MTALAESDIETMFRDCILEHQGELVVVRDIVHRDDGYKLAVRRPGQRNNILIDPNPDEVFCPSMPYRLGYFQNGTDCALYLSRTPRRQYKVGWCEGNVNNLRLTAVLSAGVKFVENLRGIFPTFQEALKLATEEARSVAFDRQFAIVESGKVLAYKGTGIAYIKNGDARLEDHDFGHLRELFNQAKDRK